MKKQDFLELLDDVNNFIFCLYMSVPEGFASMMFFTNVAFDDDPNVMSIPLSKNLDFPLLTKKSLALLAHSVIFKGENSEEMGVVYFPF